ncbi:putative multi antimicrobial extrusion protein [Helianthus annuus]|nr:putative multi antimicrobial extrusion protein [Helianthus annuus]KAJ0721278.1 putative multi antimicrobial extrusion protein [Helianthus annuus]
MVVLLSGLLPNPKLETSVLSISTRVSNELGAARPEAARLAVVVVVVIAILEGLVVGSITILVRRVWGRLYSDDEEVINYVATMMPLLALSDFLDGFQCVLSGAARGCGWQNICAVINLGAYYIVGIPCALLFAFVLHVGGMGLWMGIICALSIQVVALIAINLSTNWTDEVWKAIHRVQTSNAVE